MTAVLLGELSTEGAPIVIADAGAMARWPGDDEGWTMANVYEDRAMFETGWKTINLGDDSYLVRPVEGDNPVEVYRVGPRRIVVQQVFSERGVSTSGPRLAATPADEGQAVHRMTVASGALIVMHASCALTAITPPSGADHQFGFGLWDGDGGVQAALLRGEYEIVADVIELDGDEAFRLTIAAE